MDPIQIVVRYHAGAYHTSRIGNLRASSTHSAGVAAERLGDRLFGPGRFRAEQIGTEAVGVSSWLLRQEEAH